MTILIKRYANRKLYNTDTSRYITRKGVAALVADGADLQVIDNETGEDITAATLSQVRADDERSNTDLPSGLLSDLFQRGGDVLYGALKRGVGEAAQDGIEELQRNVRRAMRAREQDGERFRERMGDARDELKSEVDEALQAAVERVFKTLDLPRRSDIVSMNQRLDRVAEALERLEGNRRNVRPAQPHSRTREPFDEE